MPANPLETILAPKSIAVLGASSHPTKMGTMQMLNIVASGFPGQVLPVHPTEKEIFGHKVYPTIADLPFAPDLALLVVPTKLVPQMIDDLGKLGTRHAVVVTAGFKETGPDGQDLEWQVVDIANKHGLRFVGPNCMGVVNAHLPLNTAVSPLCAPPGGLSLVSQSGTYVTQTNYYLGQRGVRISKGVSVGNEASIDLVDCLEYLGDDPQTTAIGLYIECIRRPKEFLAVASRISRDKPIVAQYVGGNEFGARSGSSHTGALAGPDFIYDGLFAQAGVIRVPTIEDVYRLGDALAHQPAMKGRRVAVLTNSGGPGSGMATTLQAEGMEMPSLSPETQAKLRQHMPPHAPVGNPVDLTFHVDMSTMTKTLPRILFEDPQIDGVLLHGIMDTGWAAMAHQVFSKFIDISRQELDQMMLADLSELTPMPWAHGKPLLTSSFFDRADHAVDSLLAAQIPVFDSPERAARTMALMHRAHQIATRPAAEAPPTPPVAARASELLAAPTLDEHQAKQVLAAYGLPVCREEFCADVDQAVAAARRLGWPVAVKGCLASVQHKTELGLVHLNLADADAVAQACRKIRQAAPAAGLLVAEMLPTGRELIAGVTRFPSFPPLVLCGLGGVLAEALRDTALRLAPLAAVDGLAMLESLRGRAILGDFRGMGAVDLAAVADLLVRLGQVALNHPEIAEMDLNPILFVDGQPRIVDALIVKAGRN
ncbi:CoA-binding domain protein [Desulfarculus baarsii DSM 2075]|uniref:CoA-binding domain protein n=1 Tax=Desulfarculus baarsii (strain ATCC 33931 / DSM 2075 / LMG 7858 / VKM B-1802 / 2st14) TaxID=644282 RepID=E1QKL7_DESB2|nr:acetate--CoA ligase [Desulfarculus baarsii]ADK86110.1 CoA-binding domain protein [Desulfarculus baarsii DSM 2075]